MRSAMREIREGKWNAIGAAYFTDWAGDLRGVKRVRERRTRV
jgi:hypothetical protein